MQKGSGLVCASQDIYSFSRTPFSSPAFSQLGMRQETPQKWRYLELEMIALKKDVNENGGKLLFQLFFLKDNEDQNVEVKEVEEIDFRKVKEHLEKGESIFITLKRKEKVETRLVEEEALAEPWYLSRI